MSYLRIFLLTPFILLAGCGGGGGGGGGSQASESAPPQVAASTNRPTLSVSLPATAVNGNGAIIAIVDDADLRKNGRFRDDRRAIERISIHGEDVFTADSSLGAGSENTHGVLVTMAALEAAPGARILFARLPLSGSGTPPLVSASDVHGWVIEIGRPVRRVRAVLALPYERKPDVLNGSLGLFSPLNRYDLKALEAELRGGARKDEVMEIINMLEQKGARKKTIFVFAAGNHYDHIRTGRDSNEVSLLYAGLPAVIPELEHLWIAVVALDEKEQTRDDYSQICGQAQRWCIAASGAYRGQEGTSLAAPRVAAVFALGVERFNPDLSSGRRQVGNEEIRKWLLDSADRSGDFANAEIYGRGKLNKEGFLNPVSPPRLSVGGSSLANPGISFAVADSHLSAQTASALGDGLSRALAKRTVAAFDDRGAPYFYEMASMMGERGIGRGIARFADEGGFAIPENIKNGQVSYGWQGRDGSGFLKKFGGVSFAFNRDPSLHLGLYGEGLVAVEEQFISSAFTNPYLALADSGELGSSWAATFAPERPNKFRLGVLHSQGDGRYGSGHRGLVGEHIYKTEASTFITSLGMVGEDGKYLGNYGLGAFAPDGADSYFVGFTLHKQLGRSAKLMASALGGITSMESPLIKAERIISSSFSLGIEAGGWRLAAHQPLRAERADGILSYSEARTEDRRIVIARDKVSLTPSGRELDLELRHTKETMGGALNISALARRQPGHVRTADTAYEALIGFSKRF